MDLTVPTRPVRPDDAGRFRALWDRLSPETVYRRFHAPLRRPPAQAVSRLVSVDHDLREALVAVVGDDVVGVARYDRPATDPSTAELAVVVEDAWQGVGVGRQLMQQLIELAARRGVRTVTASVQADNDRVLELVRRLLPEATLTADVGGYEVSSPLPSPDRRLPTPATA